MLFYNYFNCLALVITIILKQISTDNHQASIEKFLRFIETSKMSQLLSEISEKNED